ncbi:hypothetical protein H8M03_12410 [Sphingomonas sabuli]|uniref:Heavy-metal resistance n=1 Tax=Sphingomonas sabuli TaxID=2764186 RepID=A0A7G9L2B9_9SPHN|nr:hypothetical protein [Sphingomonas sabuli]QNM82768.1 hypothetical protein H8M03_12410 [Sphingomonas sabuli]
MRLRPILLILAAGSAAPALAQQGPGAPASMGPNDLNRTGSMANSVPRNELPTYGGGIVLPNSPGDVTRSSEVSKAERERVMGEVRTLATQRRAEAVALAERVKKGAEVPPSLAATLREALDRDIELWRLEYTVEAQQAATMRSKWVKDPAALTAAEWVLWRAAWYEERDKWAAQSQSAAR